MSDRVMELHLAAVGVVGPGLEGWQQAAPILRGEQGYRPAPFRPAAPELLTGAERRRASDSVRLALQVSLDALSPDQATALQPAAVFASAYGDPQVTHKLCDMLSEEPPIASPILFHNSVHNAAAGYWSIALGLQTPTTSIAAGEESFTMGLLQTALQCHSEQRPVMLLGYDLPYPEPLHSTYPVQHPFACALLLTPQATAESLARLRIALSCDGTTTTQLADPALEALRLDNPSARALPLLATIALGSGDCRLAFPGGQVLRVELQAC